MDEGEEFSKERLELTQALMQFAVEQHGDRATL